MLRGAVQGPEYRTGAWIVKGTSLVCSSLFILEAVVTLKKEIVLFEITRVSIIPSGYSYLVFSL